MTSRDLNTVSLNQNFSFFFFFPNASGSQCEIQELTLLDFPGTVFEMLHLWPYLRSTKPVKLGMRASDLF